MTEKTGAELIAAERERQITEEGWTPEHDAGQMIELAWAGDSYALRAAQQLTYRTRMSDEGVPVSWPWLPEFWKPDADPVRNLVKAGALIAAAIDAELAVRAADTERSTT